VRGIVDGEKGYLYRMTDGVMFRVLEGSNSSTGGIVDLFVDHQLVYQTGHASQAQIKKCMSEAAKCMHEESKFLATYVQGEVDYEGQ
jgi:hypothetical protein